MCKPAMLLLRPLSRFPKLSRLINPDKLILTPCTGKMKVSALRFCRVGVQRVRSSLDTAVLCLRLKFSGTATPSAGLFLPDQGVPQKHDATLAGEIPASESSCDTQGGKKTSHRSRRKIAASLLVLP